MAGLGSGRSDPGHSSPDTAEKARVAARQSAAWLRDEAAQLYDNYTKQSKYFKWRSWIVGGYALIIISSLFVVRLNTANDIEAYISWTYDFDQKLLLSVENTSTEDWTHVKLTLNDSFVLEKDRIQTGQRFTPNAGQFHKIGAKGDQATAPAKIPFKTLRVKCDQGAFTKAAE